MPNRTLSSPSSRSINGFKVISDVQTNLTGVLNNQVVNWYTSPTKRKKPVGIELLFNPTSWSMAKRYCYDGIATHAWDGTRADPNKPGSYIRTTNFAMASKYMFTGSGFSPPTTWHPHPLPTNSRLLGEIKSQGVNLAMMLAEYRQTAGMVEKAAEALWKTYRGLRKGNIAALRNLRPDSAAGAWLVYRYGITPLISDIKGIMQLLTDSKATPLIKKFSVSHASEIARSTSSVWNTYSNKVMSNVVIDVAKRRKVRDVAYVQYSNVSLANISSVGLTNPALLAWELIPYSFVVDWFISVGDYLAGLDALTGTSRVSAVRISRETMFEDWKQGAIRGGTAYDRYLLSLSPTLPRWDPSPTWKRIVDSVALTRQRFGR